MARKKMVVKKIGISLWPPELEIITKIEEKGLSVGETVRMLIRQYGKEEFPETPAYAEAARMAAELRKEKLGSELASSKMTNEEYATTILKGKINRHGRVVFMKANGGLAGFELATIKKQTAENNGYIKMHQQLLDRTFLQDGGKPFDEKYYETLWKDW